MRLLRPDCLIARVSEISLEQLWQKGIRSLLIDVDNTIAVWNEQVVPVDIENWLAKARARGFSIVLISNNHASRIKPLAERLQVEMLATAGKPRRHAFWRAAALVGMEYRRCAVIGDQLMTDTLGANRAGMYSILVTPLHGNEFWGTKINRRLEQMILLMLRIRRPCADTKG